MSELTFNSTPGQVGNVPTRILVYLYGMDGVLTCAFSINVLIVSLF